LTKNKEDTLYAIACAALETAIAERERDA